MVEKRYIHISDLIALYSRCSVFMDLPELAEKKPKENLLPSDPALRHSGAFDIMPPADRLHVLHEFLLHGEDDTLAITATKHIMRAYLGDKYPFIENIKVPEWPTKRHMLIGKKRVSWEQRNAQLVDFLYEMEQKYGAWFEVEPLPNYKALDPAETMEKLGQDPTKLLSSNGRSLEYRNLRMEEVERLPQNDYLDVSKAVFSICKSSSPPIVLRPEQFKQKPYRDTKGEVISIGLDTLDKDKATKLFSKLEQHFETMGLDPQIDLHFDTSGKPHQYSIRIEAQQIQESEAQLKALQDYAHSRIAGHSGPPVGS
jgi:hypothetical protein